MTETATFHEMCMEKQVLRYQRKHLCIFVHRDNLFIYRFYSQCKAKKLMNEIE